MSMVVLISGGGSNLQAMIDQWSAGCLPVTPAAVVSNRADAAGLKRAERAGVATHVVAARAGEERDGYDRRLMQTIDRYQPGIVVLAGFMRILGAEFVCHYEGRMLNIHPSLLPAYRGLHTHRRALQDKAHEHGASVHFVTEELDGGPLVLQARVEVRADDTEQTLAARVLEYEHRIYPTVVRWFAEGRLQYRRQRVYMDGRPLTQPLQWADIATLQSACGAQS